MATKAETFRYWTERSGPKKPKSAPRPRRNGAVTAAGGAQLAPGERPVTAHKESVRASKKAPYALEITEGRPSRKSTRKAANRLRTDVKMQVKLRMNEVRPSVPRGIGY